MNPLMGFSQMMGVGMGLVSMVGGMVSQGAAIHRQLTPAQQQTQIAQNCQPPTIPMVMVKANGTRQIVCVQNQQVQP